MALLLTLISGLFFLIGIIIYNFTSNKTSFTRMSISCASIVIIGLILFDLLPELINLKKWWIFLWIISGMTGILQIRKILLQA